MEKRIEKINKFVFQIKECLILSIVFVFPLAFAPFFIDNYNPAKIIILGFFICLALIAIGVETYMKGKLMYARGRFDIAVFALLGAYLISAVVISPNKMDAFFLPGTASFVIGSALVYFLLNTIADRPKLKMALIASASVLSLVLAVSLFRSPNAPILNPAGDYITGIIFIVAATFFAIFLIIKEKIKSKKIVLGVSIFVMFFGIVVSLLTLSDPAKKAMPILPPFNVSWAVAVDTIRESPVFGIGAGNYLTAFNRFRPISYNATSLWQIRFAAAHNWYLTVITETGLLGGIALVVLFLSLYKDRAKKGIVLIGMLLLLLILPATALTVFLLFVLLSLRSEPEIKSIATDEVGKFFLIVGIVILVLFLFVKARPVILAEAKFKEANDALSANDAKKTYEDLQVAITLNPNVDRYHESYAQMNLAIARSIATSIKDPANLTVDQKSVILQLLQQAIHEGQVTVNLNPTRADNWRALANVYQLIIPYATKADQFAIQSYNQTIDLDPVDPNVRISLGSVYYSLSQFDSAISAFQVAVLAKPDLPNAYFNLATAYAAKNDFTNATLAMQKTVDLLPKNSPDYKIAQDALANLQKKQKTLQDTTNSTNLTTPTKQATSTPQLTLPQEATPPAAAK